MRFSSLALWVLPISRFFSHSSRLFPSVSVKTPCFPMESLQLTRVLSCKLSTNISRKGCSFRPIRQLGFGLFLRREFSKWELDGCKMKKKEKKKKKEKHCLMLGIDRDDSGSVIGLHLIPPSGIFTSLNCWDFFFSVDS